MSSDSQIFKSGYHFYGGVMKKRNLLLAFVLLLATACQARSVVPAAADLNCAAIVAGMLTLSRGLSIPDNFMAEEPVRTGAEFDPNQFFSVLTHLSMAPGYSLDYVYHRDGLGAFPILYARPLSQPRYATEAALAAAGDEVNYLDFVQTDGSAEGYFELVVLSMMGNQFYLDWHANYNDTRLVCNRTQAIEIAQSLNDGFGYPMPLVDRFRIHLLRGVEPAVEIGEQTVQVRVVTFSHWGGFSRVTVSIHRSFPHTILDIQEQVLIPYDCGIRF
jgi:hypothetical protein